MHELYTVDHLIETVVSYYQVTEKEEFLKFMREFADYITSVFADENTKFMDRREQR